MIDSKKGYPMKNKNKLSDIWAVYLVIALLTLIMIVGVANATPPPTSRITAEPEFLEDYEKDDGKYAMMLNKGVLCDKDTLLYTRFATDGYIRAFRGVNPKLDGFYTIIWIKSTFDLGKYYMTKIAVMEVDTKTNIACIISENINPEYNSNHLYIEIYPSEPL